MSDEVYDADGDVSRYLQTASPESHLLAVPDGERVEAHVGSPQDLPAVQGAVALPTPPPAPLDLSRAAFALQAPNNDDENHQAMTMDVPPPPPPANYGFPDPIPALVPARIDDHLMDAVDDGNSVLQNIGTLSLYDHLMHAVGDGRGETLPNRVDEDAGDHVMDDGDDGVEALLKSVEDDAGNSDSSAAVADHSEYPVEEGLTFVRFVPGELDCSKCRSVRDVLHESANHNLRYVLHVANPGTFEHAIIDRAYIDADGQTILTELGYLDLRQRTNEWVQNFMANIVEMLKNDTSGQLTDNSWPTPPANNNDMHRELEMDMLKQILSTPSPNTEAGAVSVPHQESPETHQTVVTRAEENTNNTDHIVLNAAHVPEFLPTILESSQVSVQGGMSSGASATDYESQLAKQRKRISQMTLEDIAKFMHMSKKDAAKELNISDTTLKRLCRKNNTDRWPARKINSLDSKIKKLEQAAKTNVGTKGLLAIMEKINMLKAEKEQVYASVWKVIQENQKPNDGPGTSGGSCK